MCLALPSLTLHCCCCPRCLPPLQVKPQKWDLFEVWFVAITLGLVACLSSMILLTWVMHANVLNPGGWANLWASDGRDYMLFAELRTVM